MTNQKNGNEEISWEDTVKVNDIVYEICNHRWFNLIGLANCFAVRNHISDILNKYEIKKKP